MSALSGIHGTVEGAAVGLDDITRRVGLGIAFLGAFVANPGVPRLAVAKVRSAGRWINRQWKRLLRRPTEIRSASGGATGLCTVSGTGRDLRPLSANSTVEERSPFWTPGRSASIRRSASSRQRSTRSAPNFKLSSTKSWPSFGGRRGRSGVSSPRCRRTAPAPTSVRCS